LRPLYFGWVSTGLNGQVSGKSAMTNKQFHIIKFLLLGILYAVLGERKLAWVIANSVRND
jgi:hypothetical protein